MPERHVVAGPAVSCAQADSEAIWAAMMRWGINITLFVRGAPQVLRETSDRERGSLRDDALPHHAPVAEAGVTIVLLDPRPGVAL
jgi:hypothetical protein